MVTLERGRGGYVRFEVFREWLIAQKRPRISSLCIESVLNLLHSSEHSP